MLGRDHLLLSVATVSLVLAPLFSLYPTAVLVAVVGTAIGSLIPDADSPDVAILHTEVSGLRGGIGRLLNSFGVLYPVFGYATKYLIYKPAVWVYDTVVFEETPIVERHRGFLHSVLGLGTATALTGLYLLAVLYVLELFSMVFLEVFLLAYLVGALLHLVEDSCTRSGIQWFYPVRRWKVRGELKTSPRLQDTVYQRVFLVVLGGGVVVLFFLPSIYGQGSAIQFAVIGLVAGVLLWVGLSDSWPGVGCLGSIRGLLGVGQAIFLSFPGYCALAIGQVVGVRRRWGKPPAARRLRLAALLAPLRCLAGESLAALAASRSLRSRERRLGWRAPGPFQSHPR